MKNNSQVKIAVFFGGKISQHLVLLKKAAKKLGTRLDLVSYNRVNFDTNELKVKIRGSLKNGIEDKVKNDGWLEINDYDVLFFRTTGKHWEEVDLIMSAVNQPAQTGCGRYPVIVDPLVKLGKPSYACKAWQMLQLKKANIDVPKTIYGSLWFLYEIMSESLDKPNPYLNFPVIVKGSSGDRGSNVFKADSLEEFEKLVKELRKFETEGGKRYMLQEYIPNDGDYRVLVLGKKVLGVMKRSSQSKSEFRNNYSAGGAVEIADLPEEVKNLAVKAADVCGLWVAGVDVAFRDFDKTKPVIWEVNKGPQFKGFMKATGIDVPAEIVKYLCSLA